MIENKEKDLKISFTYDIDLLIQRKKTNFTESSFDKENVIKGIRHNEVELFY